MALTFSFGFNGRSEHYTIENTLEDLADLSTDSTDSLVSDGDDFGTEALAGGDFIAIANDINGPGSLVNALGSGFQSSGWNVTKNVSAVGNFGELAAGTTLELADFVHVDVDFSSSTVGADLSVENSKRGNLRGSDFDDDFTLTLATNNSHWSNQFYFDMGDGDDTVTVTAGEKQTDSQDKTKARITDGKFTTIDVDLGAGDDQFLQADGARAVQSDDIISGGTGLNLLETGAGNDTIEIDTALDNFEDFVEDFELGADTLDVDGDTYSTASDIAGLALDLQNNGDPDTRAFVIGDDLLLDFGGTKHVVLNDIIGTGKILEDDLLNPSGQAPVFGYIDTYDEFKMTEAGTALDTVDETVFI